MPRELDNAAPEIYESSGTGRAEGLWADAFEDTRQSSDEEREEIDSQEVFGASTIPGLELTARPYPVCYRSGTSCVA